MKIISFSLWGDQPKYNVGAIKNAKLARELFPDWTCRFYVGESVPKETIRAIADVDKTYLWYMDEVPKEPSHVMYSGTLNSPIQIFIKSTPGDWRMMLDRFSPVGEADVDVMISRDCDSRLSIREKLAVDEWLESPHGFHTMHDHPHHSVPILGGMFGIKKGLFSELARHAIEWGKSHESRWQIDQDFLTDIVWPVVQNDTMNHDEFFRHLWGGRPFSSQRLGLEFVGATYDANDCIDQSQMSELAKYIRKNI